MFVRLAFGGRRVLCVVCVFFCASLSVGCLTLVVGCLLCVDSVLFGYFCVVGCASCIVVVV